MFLDGMLANGCPTHWFATQRPTLKFSSASAPITLLLLIFAIRLPKIANKTSTDCMPNGLEC